MRKIKIVLGCACVCVCVCVFGSVRKTTTTDRMTEVAAPTGRTTKYILVLSEQQAKNKVQKQKLVLYLRECWIAITFEHHRNTLRSFG